MWVCASKDEEKVKVKCRERETDRDREKERERVHPSHLAKTQKRQRNVIEKNLKTNISYLGLADVKTCSPTLLIGVSTMKGVDRC